MINNEWDEDEDHEGIRLLFQLPEVASLKHNFFLLSVCLYQISGSEGSFPAETTDQGFYSLFSCFC